MGRKFKSSMWMFLFVFVFTVKVNAQAEPQLEKRVVNMGSSNSSYKIEETNLQDKQGLGDYWGKIFYIPYYFPLKQGAEWKYKVTENGQTCEKRIKIDGTKIIDGVSTVKRYVFDSNEEGYFVCMALSKEGVLAYESYSLDEPPSESTYASPPYIFFPFKMEMGKEFSSHCLWAEYGDSPEIPPSEFDELVISSRVVELEEIEDVVVPAGKFKRCLRLRISEVSDESPDMDSSGDHEVCREKVWLAPGVGIVKVSGRRSEFNSTQKIIEKNYYTEELFSYSGLKS